MKRVMLYFGSFNPVHKGHIALAEYAVRQALCDEVVLIVSPQSPYKATDELAPEMDRFEMAEIACAASEYPDRIKPSVVEFLLPKPSYTIDTLHYLKDNFGSGMEFSILMGSDQIARLDGWKEYEKILEYPVYVYPRRDKPAKGFEGRITLLTDAPLQDFASTDVRDRIGRGEDTSEMLDEGVAAYIRRKGLWSPASRIAALTARIAEAPDDTELYIERGRLHYRLGEWGPALNDFNRVLALDEGHVEARQFARMVQEIYRSSAPGLPIAAYDDLSAFKIYLVDVGLLRRLAQLAPTAFGEGNRLFTEFKGALTENFVLQTLITQFEVMPRYWSRNNPPYEVDFLIQRENDIFPVEVKSEANTTSRSMKKFKELFPDKVKLRIRFSLDNLKLDDDMLNIPLFMADQTDRLIGLALEQLQK